jgi:hypothetical protein
VVSASGWFHSAFEFSFACRILICLSHSCPHRHSCSFAFAFILAFVFAFNFAYSHSRHIGILAKPCAPLSLVLVQPPQTFISLNEDGTLSISPRT